MEKKQENSERREKLRSIKRGKGLCVYFTKEHENAIVQYNKEENAKKREKIFNEIIYEVFGKIVDNLIAILKMQNIYDVESVREDCITHMYEKMFLFDPEMGYKAFSFFSVIAKNFLLKKRNEDFKTKKNFVDSNKNNLNFQFLTPFIGEENAEELYCEKEIYKEQIDHYIRKVAGAKFRKNTITYQVFIGLCVFLMKANQISYGSYNRKAMVDFIANYLSIDKKKVISSLYRIKKKSNII